jgi:hypothetical protein
MAQILSEKDRYSSSRSHPFGDESLAAEKVEGSPGLARKSKSRAELWTSNKECFRLAREAVVNVLGGR